MRRAIEPVRGGLSGGPRTRFTTALCLVLSLIVSCASPPAPRCADSADGTVRDRHWWVASDGLVLIANKVERRTATGWRPVPRMLSYDIGNTRLHGEHAGNRGQTWALWLRAEERDLAHRSADGFSGVLAMKSGSSPLSCRFVLRNETYGMEYVGPVTDVYYMCLVERTDMTGLWVTTGTDVIGEFRISLDGQEEALRAALQAARDIFRRLDAGTCRKYVVDDR